MEEKNLLEEAIERYATHLAAVTPGSDEALKIMNELEKLYKLRNEQYKIEADSYAANEKLRIEEESFNAELEETKRQNDLKETELKQKRSKDRADTICNVLGVAAKVGLGVGSLFVTCMTVAMTQEYEVDNAWISGAKAMIPKVFSVLGISSKD